MTTTTAPSGTGLPTAELHGEIQAEVGTAPSPNPRGSLAKISDDLVYYPHQIEGVRWMDKRGSFILSDEMGLGKSIQALTAVAVAFERDETSRALVIAPASLKGNWADEIKAHTKFTCKVLTGTPKQREDILRTFDADILIVNYEQVERHITRLNNMDFGVVIYDEAHYIKSRKSGRTRACQQLRMPRHFLLTGSPLLNQVDDLWTLLNRIDPAKFPTYWKFVNRYAVWGGYQDKQIVGIKNEAELREMLQDRMLRREKKDVLNLPDKQHIVVKLDLSPAQKKLYDQLRDELRAEAPGLEDGELTVDNAMVKMLRLKQVCGTTASIPGHPDDSTKLDRAIEMVQELIDDGHPVVVFTQFREVLACFAQRLHDKKIKFSQLHGDIAADARQPIVRTWSEDAKAGKAGVMLCMFQVAGVGLNMTSARHLIFLDKLYVPKLNEQAEDRIHRIGADETQPIQIFHLHMRNTIDTRIENILKTKSDIFDAVVSTDNSAWKKKLIAAVLDDADDE